MRASLLAALSALVLAQTIPAPEFADVFYRLDGEKLVPLERQTVHLQVNGRFASAKVVAQFQGTQSTVRFLQKNRLEFIVKATSDMDPQAVYALKALDSKKKTREMLMSTAHATPFTMSAKVSTPDSLPVEFTKSGPSLLKITVGPLAAGEYAIGKIHGEAVFCFGID